MAREILTAARVKSAKFEQRTDIWDIATPSLCLRVSPPSDKRPEGAKTWTIFYRHAGRPRRYKLGDFPALSLTDARKEAQRIRGDVARGIDPQGVKMQARVEAKQAVVVGTTFGQLAERYIKHAQDHGKRSWNVDQRFIDGDLAAWKSRPLEGPDRINKHDVANVMDAIAHRVAKRAKDQIANGRPATFGTGVIANRVLALVSTIFNAGAGWYDLDYNPALRYPKPAAERKSKRALKPHEIKALWKALDSKPAKQAAFVKLVLLTGCREREVLQAEVREFDFDAATWTIRAERVKTGRKSGDFTIPLTPAMMDLVASIKNGSPYLFPMQQKKPRPMRAYCLWIDTLRDELKFAEDWTSRALRHTAFSGMKSVGVSHEIAERCLNHRIPGIGAAHYDQHDYMAQMREALMAWDAEVRRIVS